MCAIFELHWLKGTLRPKHEQECNYKVKNN